jgi:hypothetical protein
VAGAWQQERAKPRTAYQRAYYRDTAPQRRKLARHRRQLKRWTAWLLAELGLSPVYPLSPDRIQPIRRPLLRLNKKDAQALKLQQQGD